MERQRSCRLANEDRLVVDMSMQAVKQGVTDPHEIKRLLKRGVKVFTRGNLHAKFLIAGNTLIAGSANISRNARTVLDEAGVVTTDPAALQRAKTFFEKLCTEPVRPKYLAECIKQYRPPRFKAAVAPTSDPRRPKREVNAKLWLVRGLVYRDLPQREQKRADAAESRAKKKLRDPDRTEVSTTHYAQPIAFLKRLRQGDWVITEINFKGGSDVSPPASVLAVDSYPRGKGKRRYLLLTETPQSAETISGTKFRNLARKIDKRLVARRTQPVANDESADAILRLWTPAGRLRTRKK
jgi:hypothetical protein